MIDQPWEVSDGVPDFSGRPSVPLVEAEVPRPAAAVLTLPCRMSCGDIPELCRRVEKLLEEGIDVLVCDLSAIEQPDAVVLEAVARFQLLARRAGCQVRIDRGSGAVDGLFELAGLKDSAVFPI